MSAVAAALIFALLTPSGQVAENLVLATGLRIEAPDTDLGYTAEQADWVAAVRDGDAPVTVQLGDWELERGEMARAHAWFEFGTRLGDPGAQEHLVFVQQFMTDERREAASAFGAELLIAFDHVSPVVTYQPLS